jgi:hypothetical protein
LGGCIRNGWRKLNGDSTSENEPLLEQQAGTRQQFAHQNDLLNQAPSARGTVWAFLLSLVQVIKGEVEMSPSHLRSMIMITTILFLGFVASVLAAIFSAKVGTDSVARSSSKHCGFWVLDNEAGDKAQDLDDLYRLQKEARASHYARTCYNKPVVMAPTACNFFYNQSIRFSTKSQQLCPFESAEMCISRYSAVIFDTGLVDASVIGINARGTHKFRRKTTCSPLKMTEPYVRKVSPEDSNSTAFRYYYGETDNAEYTFNTSGSPFDWLVPVYSVK